VSQWCGGVLGLVVGVMRVVPFSSGQLARHRLHQPHPGHAPAGSALRVLLRPAPDRHQGRCLDGRGCSLSIYARPFFGEIWRGSLQSVSQRQWEAGAALGLTYRSNLFHVVLPQALRISIAPTVGFLVQLVKDTSLTALIGFIELTRASQIISGATFAPLQVYLDCGRHLLRHLLQPVAAQPDAGKETPCRSLRSRHPQALRPRRGAEGRVAVARKGRDRRGHRPLGLGQVDDAALHQRARTRAVGRIVVDGIEVTAADADLNVLRQRAGMVFQSYNLFPHLTAERNVMLALRLVRKMDKESAREGGT
jgi:polar amino acid transport system permease protein